MDFTPASLIMPSVEEFMSMNTITLSAEEFIFSSPNIGVKNIEIKLFVKNRIEIE